MRALSGSSTPQTSIVDGVAKLRPGAPVTVGGAAKPAAPGGAPAPAPAKDAPPAPKA